MTNFGNLPFEKLIAYQEARKLLEAMREAAISEGRLRDQALRAATSVCLNISEGAGRAGSADKARVYAIARGENCEAAAALDIALAAGTCKPEPARRALPHARAVHALLSGLIRRFGISG
jgi:four helix bundle protein